MSLRDQLESSGSWLFRHRSYLPLLALPIFAFCLLSSEYLKERHRPYEFWQLACLAVSFAGLALRIMIVGRAPKGTSGRNTKEQVANTLTTTGVYSLVRHPLYVGNYLIVLGFILLFQVWWLVLVMSCLYALYYERIMLAEEAFLRQRFGQSFEEWAAATPVFIPRLKGWKPSPVPFSWRTVMQREYNAFFLIIGVFFLLNLLGLCIAQKPRDLDNGWFVVLIAGFLIFAVLRSLKKRTRLLHVEGR